MSEWARHAVRDLIDAHYSGPSPTCEERHVRGDEEWGLLKTTAITWENGWDWRQHKVPPARYWGQSQIEVRSGDVLVTKAGPRHRVGVVAYVADTPTHLMASGKMIGLRPRSEVVVPLVLACALSTTEPQRFLDHRTTGMAESQVNFANSTLLGTSLALPVIAEQRRIAEILTTLDQVIGSTKQLIAKLLQMKQGLVHNLLMRGVDENGELRDPQQHPEQFTDSAIGRIPTTWQVARLVEVMVLPSGQLDPKLMPYRSWPLIAPDHIEAGTGRLLSKETAASQGAISGKYGFHAGDVLYSKIRPYLRKATLADCEGLCSADMYPLRPGVRIRSRFLLAVILAEDFSRFAESVSMRSGFPKINREELSEYSLGLPDLAEQDRFGQILSTFDDRMAYEESLLSKLCRLKAGLMDDLLTGHTRVAKLYGGSDA